LGMAWGATAGLVVLIQQTGSMFAILFAYLLFRHKPTSYDIIWIVFGLISIYLICSTQGTSGGVWAIVALVASAMMWALGFALVKKSHASSVPTTVWTSLFVIPTMAVATGTHDGWDTILNSLSQASFLAWSTVFFAGWVSLMGAG